MSRAFVSKLAKFQPRRFLNVSSRDGDIFTHHGVLPFLQYRINSMLSEKHVNVSPTEAQMGMFAVLNDNKSLVIKDNIQSGKSFGMLVYAINKELQQTRQLIRSSNSDLSTKPISSCIIVPNNTLLLKYKEWAEQMILELKPECCPVNINEGDEAETNFVPLNIQVVDRNGNWTMLSTEKDSTKERKPQIVITSASQFARMILDENASKNIPSKEDFIDCKFLGLDEATFIFNSSLSSDRSSNFWKSEKKGKIEFLWSRSMKVLRHLQLKAHSARNISKKHEKLDPLQYCFIFHAQHPFKRTYDHLMKSDNDIKFIIPNSIDYSFLEEKLDQHPDHETEIIKDLVKYNFEELEFYKGHPSVIKLESFLNSLFYKTLDDGNVHKKLNLSVVSMKGPKNSKTKQRDFAFTDVATNQPERSQIFKMFQNSPKVSSFINLYKKHLKNMVTDEKLKLQSPNINFGISQDLLASIKLFQQTFSNDEPILILVPSQKGLSYHAKKINASGKLKDKVVAYKDFHKISSLKYPPLSLIDEKQNQLLPGDAISQFFANQNQQGVESRHLLFPSSEIAGAHFNGLKNIIIYASALNPTLATADYETEAFKSVIGGILGIRAPSTDLFYYYILLLQMDQDGQDRNILLILDEFHKKSANTFQQSRNLLSDMILFNDINATVNYKTTLVENIDRLGFDYSVARI